MAEHVERATNALVAAIKSLTPTEQPHSAGLRVAWPNEGPHWISRWALEFGRDLRIAAADLDRAEELGAENDAVAHVENALWRVAAGYEKFQDVIALGLGVPALQLTKSKRGIKRFEADRKKNRMRLAELGATHESAETLRSIDEVIFNHRFLELRNQVTHSLAPILEWRSLIWFEVGVVADGGVIGYEGKHLTPAERIQGLDTPPEELFARAVADGREVIALLVTAMERLAGLLSATGQLEPPPVLWQVNETGELFFERDRASEHSREARHKLATGGDNPV